MNGVFVAWLEVAQIVHHEHTNKCNPNTKVTSKIILWPTLAFLEDFVEIIIFQTIHSLEIFQNWLAICVHLKSLIW